MTDENTSAATDTSLKRSQFSSTLLPVLTAIGTGIGAIGFVIFFGGFIMWTRFDAAGLPANEAVAQVPRSDLIATGASFLVPAFLAAFAAAALAFTGFDAVVEARWRRNRQRLESDANKAQVDLERLLGQLEQAAVEIKWAEDKMASLERGPDLNEPGPSGENARAAYDAAANLLNERDKWLLDARVNLVPEAKAAKGEIEQQLKESERRSSPERFGQILIGGAVMAAVELFVIRSSLPDLPSNYAALVLGVAAFSIVIAIVAVSITDHLAWLIVCVFMGVGVTIAVNTYASTHNRPRVSPFVALHAHHLPITGFFVAETPDTVYLGRPEPDWQVDGDLNFMDEGATLVRFPKESLSAIAIGPLLGEADAFRRSMHLALVLCRGSNRIASRTRPRESRCNPAAVRRLRASLAMLRSHS